MYRKDLITSEIEKLAQALSKILGLQVELRLKEAQLLFDETLLTGFGLEKSLLLDPADERFALWLETNGLTAEKLNLLTDFLFSELDFESGAVQSQLYARKLNLIYECLVNKHHTVHLINLGRQKYIQQYL